MKQIMFCSIVRDGVKYLDNYFNQLITVGATYGTTITLSICELSRCRLSLVDAMIGHDIVKYGYTFVLDKLSRVIHP